jgi:ankyrin repeat protein
VNRLFFRSLLRYTLTPGLALFCSITWSGPLHDAVETGNLHKVRQLVEKDAADINKIDTRGIWPLLAAASDGNTEMVKLLLALHADPNQTDQYHYSALHEAASLGFRDVVEMLIQARADINARDINGITPLGYAMRSPSMETATLLQDFGATQ